MIPQTKANGSCVFISIFQARATVTTASSFQFWSNASSPKNAELLKQNTKEVLNEAERGVVDLKTLKKVNADLIETIQDTLVIQQQGREKRVLVENGLLQIEESLKEALMQARVQEPNRQS